VKYRQRGKGTSRDALKLWARQGLLNGAKRPDKCSEGSFPILTEVYYPCLVHILVGGFKMFSCSWRSWNIKF
jgi:hypothetical protein